METRSKIIIGSGIAGVAVIATIGGVVVATTADDAEEPITGEALERATAVALEEVGEGRVSETEVGDEDSYYEVEVTLDDGSQVDVQLDEKFNVVGSEADGPADDAGDSDD